MSEDKNKITLEDLAQMFGDEFARVHGKIDVKFQEINHRIDKFQTETNEHFLQVNRELKSLRMDVAEVRTTVDTVARKMTQHDMDIKDLYERV